MLSHAAALWPFSSALYHSVVGTADIAATLPPCFLHLTLPIVYTACNNRKMPGHRTRKVRAILLVREPVVGANRWVGPQKLPREP